MRTEFPTQNSLLKIHYDRTPLSVTLIGVLRNL